MKNDDYKLTAKDYRLISKLLKILSEECSRFVDAPEGSKKKAAQEMKKRMEKDITPEMLAAGSRYRLPSSQMAE